MPVRASTPPYNAAELLEVGRSKDKLKHIQHLVYHREDRFKFGDEYESEPDFSQLTCMNYTQKKENWNQNQNGENLRSSKNREQIDSAWKPVNYSRIRK